MANYGEKELKAHIKSGEFYPIYLICGDEDYLKKRVEKALASLPPLLRDAFVLFQISELSVREISLQLGISESLVKVRIFRAKQKLKEALSDLDQF